MSKRILTVLVVVMVTVGLLTGCSKKEQSLSAEDQALLDKARATLQAQQNDQKDKIAELEKELADTKNKPATTTTTTTSKTDTKSDTSNSTTSNSTGTISGGKLTIPDGTKTIAVAEYEKKNITSVVIPNSVTTIGNVAFAGNKLTSVTIPNSVTSIGGSAFIDNQLTSVTIGNSVKTIDWNAFYGNKLTNVVIPNSVTSIGEKAFQNNQLTSVTIGNSVTSIGDEAFRGNQLTSVTIPASVKTIGKYAFQQAEYTLNKVTFLGNGVNIGSSALQGINSAYEKGGAGTYIYEGTGRWTKEVEDGTVTSERKGPKPKGGSKTDAGAAVAD